MPWWIDQHQMSEHHGMSWMIQLSEDYPATEVSRTLPNTIQISFRRSSQPVPVIPCDSDEGGSEGDEPSSITQQDSKKRSRDVADAPRKRQATEEKWEDSLFLA